MYFIENSFFFLSGLLNAKISFSFFFFLQQHQSHRDTDLASLMAAAVADEKQLRALTRSSRSSGSNIGGSSGETTIEKVTLSPVAAASIAGLPPQTSITIAPSPSSSKEVNLI